MLSKKIHAILKAGEKTGWIIEPEAKKLLSLAGLNVPRFKWTTTLDEALEFVHSIGYPVVVKVVSPEILHKSDVGGVLVGVDSDEQLKAAFQAESSFSTFQHLSGVCRHYSRGDGIRSRIDYRCQS
jgi:acyl-CoA synthetase (NDP forming)